MWLPHSIPKGEGEGKLQRLWLKSINAPNQHLPSTMDHHHRQWATLCSDLLDLLGRSVCADCESESIHSRARTLTDAGLH